MALGQVFPRGRSSLSGSQFWAPLLQLPEKNGGPQRVKWVQVLLEDKYQSRPVNASPPSVWQHLWIVTVDKHL